MTTTGNNDFRLFLNTNIHNGNHQTKQCPTPPYADGHNRLVSNGQGQQGPRRQQRGGLKGGTVIFCDMKYTNFMSSVEAGIGKEG